MEALAGITTTPAGVRLGTLDLVAPLAVPTPDAGPSVAHPDIVDLGSGGWNGYRYWVGFTPYPGADRENPCIVASNDLVTWVVPAGLTNPLATSGEAVGLGFLWNSDTDLVHLPSGDLALYWRMYRDDSAPNYKERIYRRTSSDGSTWTTKAQVIDSPGTLDTILSPCIEVEADNSYSMWCVNNTAGTVTRRTSADGLAFSAPTTCTIPSGISPWHVDVVRVGSTYHMLLNALESGNAHHLLYLTSTDGLAFTGSTLRAVPLSGTQYDAAGRHYRSTFTPGTVANTWHVLATGLPINPLTGTGAPADGNPWRLLLYRNLHLN